VRFLVWSSRATFRCGYCLCWVNDERKRGLCARSDITGLGCGNLFAMVSIAASHTPPWPAYGWEYRHPRPPTRKKLLVRRPRPDAGRIGLRSGEVPACKALARATPRCASRPAVPHDAAVVDDPLKFGGGPGCVALWPKTR
jgi:hypothetical protein